MAGTSFSFWIPFFLLLVYAAICQFGVAARLIQHQVPVPWSTIGVPLHLFQHCRERRAVVGPALQWWSLSADVAVLGCLGLFVAAWLQRG